MTPGGTRDYLVVNDATLTSLGNWEVRAGLAELRMPARTIGDENSMTSMGQSARVFASALPGRSTT